MNSNTASVARFSNRILQRRLLLLFLGWAASGVQAQGTQVSSNPSWIPCFVSKIEFAGTDSAQVFFNKLVRGDGYIKNIGDPPTGLQHFRFDGSRPLYIRIEKQGWVADPEALEALPLGRQREANLRFSHHDRCAIRWDEENGVSGIRISATSSYVPAGEKPRTVSYFYRLQGH